MDLVPRLFFFFMAVTLDIFTLLFSISAVLPKNWQDCVFGSEVFSLSPGVARAQNRGVFRRSAKPRGPETATKCYAEGTAPADWRVLWWRTGGHSWQRLLYHDRLVAPFTGA